MVSTPARRKESSSLTATYPGGVCLEKKQQPFYMHGVLVGILGEIENHGLCEVHKKNIKSKYIVPC